MQASMLHFRALRRFADGLALINSRKVNLCGRLDNSGPVQANPTYSETSQKTRL